MMLIVFEGLDGVGKSTVINGVAERLNAKRMRTPSPPSGKPGKMRVSVDQGTRSIGSGEHDGVR